MVPIALRVTLIRMYSRCLCQHRTIGPLRVHQMKLNVVSDSIDGAPYSLPFSTYTLKS